MFKTILCPLDGSDHARKALDLAIQLCKAGGGRLILLHTLLNSADTEELRRFARIEGLAPTVEPELARLRALEGRMDFGYEELPTSSRVLADVGQHILDDAKRDAEEAGLKQVETHLFNGDTAAQVLRTVDKEGVDCVVMGSRGLSDVKALVLGSVSHAVANKVPCSCILVK